MWSGPRNISTALMRSWGNRSDTIVCDEPLYAHYLQETGRPHPAKEEVIASQDTNWRNVVKELTTGELPGGKSIYYQKHMTHHFLPCIGKDWLEHLTNCFLIRDPHEMLTSLAHVLPEMDILDTGLPQQAALFDWVREHNGEAPVVIDAKDLLEDPRGLLQAFCHELGVPFEEAMLEWPPGPRDTDGVWGPHWYTSVYESTTFVPYHKKKEKVAAEHLEILDECVGFYETLHPHRLTC
jgi:hypothetical protein